MNDGIHYTTYINRTKSTKRKAVISKKTAPGKMSSVAMYTWLYTVVETR